MRFVKESIIPAPVEAVFAFHERPNAFGLLQPPWERLEVVQPPASLEAGTVVIAKSKLGPITFTIEAEHVAYAKNERFEDVMRKGPFAKWHHKHLFSPHSQGCRLRDEIDYELPGGVLGRLAARLGVQSRLKRMFDYRHEVTRREVLQACAGSPAAPGSGSR